jgi:hypothetical protein
LSNNCSGIYDLTLSSPDTIRLDGKSTLPALTRGCRFLRHEGLPWYFARNKFSAEVVNGDVSNLVGFFIMLGRDGIELFKARTKLAMTVKFTTFFDMPVGLDCAQWAQPLSPTIEGFCNYLHMVYLDREPVDSIEIGGTFLNWISAPGRLDILRREREAKALLDELPHRHEDGKGVHDLAYGAKLHLRMRRN